MGTDIALLVLRLTVGGAIAAHGAQKLFGWFGGYGLTGTAGMFGSYLRLRPALLWTLAAGMSELGGGVLLAAGLLTPLGALGVIASVTMATILVHREHFFVSDNGAEYTLVLAAAALTVGLIGPGAYSVDALVGIALHAPTTLLAGLVGAAGGIAVALATRAPAAAPSVAEQPEHMAEAA